MAIVYLNGDFCEEHKAFIPTNDRGFLYGDGLFETIRIYDGVPFLLEEHVQRLLNSASELKIETNLDRKKIRHIVRTLIEKNSLSEAVVRITLTRGAHSGELNLTQSTQATVFISVRQSQSFIPTTSRKPLSVITLQGYGNRHKLARHKTLSYLSYLTAREEAKAKGADDAILLSETGEVLEATTANIFLVKEGQIFTPPLESGILPGITRKEVIEISKKLKIKTSETPLTVDDLKTAEEIFLTNSVIEVLSVSSVDGIKMEKPVGEITKSIAESYKQKVVAYTQSGKTNTEEKLNS